MFEKPDSPAMPPTERFQLPPLETFEVEMSDGKLQLFEGHSVQTPDSGGLNILRVVQVGESEAMRKIEVFLAPGQWRAVRQLVTEPSRIIH